MTEAEMMAEIARLNAEVDRLKGTAQKKPAQDPFPDELLEKHSSLYGILWNDNRVTLGWKKYKMGDAFGAGLSATVRATLYPESKECSEGKTREKYITCRNMTAEQYERYLAAMDCLLDTLEGIRISSKEGAQRWAEATCA